MFKKGGAPIRFCDVLELHFLWEELADEVIYVHLFSTPPWG